MEKERTEGSMVLVEEEEVVDQDQSGDLETRPRRRKQTTDQPAEAAAAEEEEADGAAAVAAEERPLEEKVEEEEVVGRREEQRSVYYDQEQGVWKCRHCTWTYGLFGPGRDYVQNHEGNCQLAMDERSLNLLESFYDSPSKAAVSLDTSEVAGKKSQEDVQVGAKGQNMNGTINSKHDVNSSLGNSEVDNNSELLKAVKFEYGSSSQSYSEVYSSKAIKNDDEIQESQEIKIVKTSELKTTEYNLERILEEQDTHDLYCPNCNSCITRRVILRKRKRTVREVQSDAPAKKVHEEQDHAGKLSTSEISADNEISNQDDGQSPDVFRCLACLSFFIPTDGGYNIFRIFNKREKTLVQSSEQLPERRENWFSSFFSSDKSRKRGTESGADVTGQDKINSKSTILSGPMTIGISQNATQTINGAAALPIESAGDSESGEKEITQRANVSLSQALIGDATASGKDDSVSTDVDSIITGEQKTNISHKNKQSPSSNISEKASIEERQSRITEINADISSLETSIQNAKDKIEGKAEYEPSIQITSPSGTVVHLKEHAVFTDASMEIDAGKDIIQHVKKVSQSTQIIGGSGASDATTEVLIDVSGDSGKNDRDAGRIGRNNEWDVLKSIVYGGLVESITSLGIVSSAAGTNASTLNIFALGLANLIGGLFLIIHNLFDLRADQDEATDQKDERIGRYWELLGRRKNFRLHVFVAVTSYILFGLLPPVVYGFSFWKSDNKEYKIIAVAASALLCIALLAIGKAHVKKQAYLKSLFYYLSLGVTASGISYFAGILIDRLLEELGLFGQNTDASSPPTVTYQGVSSTIPAWASY